MSEIAKQRIEFYRAQIASREKAIDRIDNHGMKFSESYGGEKLRDVTAERKADCIAHINAMKDAMGFWRRELETRAIIRGGADGDGPIERLPDGAVHLVNDASGLPICATLTSPRRGPDKA